MISYLVVFIITCTCRYLRLYLIGWHPLPGRCLLRPISHSSSCQPTILASLETYCFTHLGLSRSTIGRQALRQPQYCHCIGILQVVASSLRRASERPNGQHRIFPPLSHTSFTPHSSLQLSHGCHCDVTARIEITSPSNSTFGRPHLHL